MLVVGFSRDVSAVFQGGQGHLKDDVSFWDGAESCDATEKLYLDGKGICFQAIHKWIDWILQYLVFLKDSGNWNFLWDLQLLFEHMPWHVFSCCPLSIYLMEETCEEGSMKKNMEATKTSKYPITFLCLKSLLFKPAVYFLGAGPKVCELGVGSIAADILLCASSCIPSVLIWHTSV